MRHVLESVIAINIQGADNFGHNFFLNTQPQPLGCRQELLFGHDPVFVGIERLRGRDGGGSDMGRRVGGETDRERAAIVVRKVVSRDP